MRGLVPTFASTMGRAVVPTCKGRRQGLSNLEEKGGIMAKRPIPERVAISLNVLRDNRYSDKSKRLADQVLKQYIGQPKDRK